MSTESIFEVPLVAEPHSDLLYLHVGQVTSSHSISSWFKVGSGWLVIAYCKFHTIQQWGGGLAILLTKPRR
jgi:hypothetical protein